MGDTATLQYDETIRVTATWSENMSDEARNKHLDWLDDCAKETDYETWLEERVTQLEAENTKLKGELASYRKQGIGGTTSMEIRNLEAENSALKRALRYLAGITGNWCIYPDGDREHVSAGVVRQVATNALLTAQEQE